MKLLTRENSPRARLRGCRARRQSRFAKSPIIKIAVLLFSIVLPVTAKAQVVTTNPLEYVALAEGNELILDKIKDQIDGQKKTALLQNTIAAEFEQMRQWEKKYNRYLKRRAVSRPR